MISVPLQIRFADCDVAGHIHNAIYLHYFETGRMHFFVSQLGKNWDWKKDGIILKKNTVEYHSPGLLTDELKIQVSCSHIGSKSFTLAYQIFNQDQVLKASGESLLVCYNYISEKTVEVPKIFLKILKLHQTNAEGYNN